MVVKLFRQFQAGHRGFGCMVIGTYSRNGWELLHSALPLHVQHSLSSISCQISVACFTRLFKKNKNKKIKLTGIIKLGMWVRSQNILSTVCRNISLLSRGWSDLKLFFRVEIIVSVVGKPKRLSSCFSGHFTKMKETSLSPSQGHDLVAVGAEDGTDTVSSSLWLQKVAGGILGFQTHIMTILGILT